MELKCVRCVIEKQSAYLAEYMFMGTSVCERHIRWVIREHEERQEDR